MALSDLPQFDQGDYIDPKTGKPFAYGSPGYNAAYAPYLLEQMHKEAERSANARGSFYSGNAIQDENLGASNILSQMQTEGARQAEQERLMLEQEAFQAQQNAANNQAAMDMTRKQASAAQKSAAISGGLSSVGTLGGLYAMNKFGALGGPAAAKAAVASGAPAYAGPMAAPAPAYSGPMAAPGAAVWESPAGVEASLPASSSAASPAVLGGPAGTAGTVGTGLGMLGAGAGGALLGYQFGGGRDDVNSKIGGGLGGLLGAGAGAPIGFALGGPVGGLIGAGLGGGLGSFGGRQLGNFFSDLF